MNERNKRNEIGELVKIGPVVLQDYSCGCWGRHHPPRIESSQIVIEVGEGYRSNKHLHGQNLYVLEVDAENRVALIEMRKYGDLYGAGLWHYLIGVDDGVLFVCQTPSTIDTLAGTLEYLKPAAVRKAKAAGQDIKRQGDWFFIPTTRTPRGEVEHNQALDDDHVATDVIRKKTVVYVRGTVVHGQHATIYLDTWHRAVRNRAIRTGRLARGGGAD